MSLAPASKDLLLKRCYGCGLVLPRSAFTRRSLSHDGLQPRCRRCKNAYRAEYRKKNPDRDREYIVRNLPRLMWRRTRERAGKRRLPFNLTEKWFEERLDQGSCELTGVPFCISIEPRHPLQPSPDRINNDPAVGYVMGNVRMIAYMANIARQNYSDEVFIEHFLSLAEGLRRGP